MTSPPSSKRRTQAGIEAWLIDEIAKRAGVPAHTVDISAPFSAYRLDSMEGVNMAGALEDFLGIELEPTLVWDFPTIEKLSRHLAQMMLERSERPEPGDRWNR